MAETKTQTTSAAAKTDDGKKYTIKTPNKGFRGERAGLAFMDGVAQTSDGIKAHMCLEFGYEVTLTATGKLAWPKEEEKERDGSLDDGVKK